MSPRHTDTSPGWIKRELKDLHRLIRESNAAKRLQAATIGRGGVTVKDGGQIHLLYPDGNTAFTLGPLTGIEGDEAGRPIGSVFHMLRENGLNVLQLFRIIPGLRDDFPDGTSQLTGSLNVFQLVATDTLFLAGPDGSMVYAGSGTPLMLSGDNGVSVNHTTTAAAANCYIDPVSAVVYRVSSSQRYKQDITDADVDVDAVLALVPRAFRRRDEVAERGDDAPTYVGFVAEEAAALGLDSWVTSDEEGPESFAYSNWGVALQAVARQHKAQIADLTARLEALEGP